MSNLIITIIGIALVAVAAIMGIMYGGTAFSNANVQASANAMINEAQQLLNAERMWAVNNNQPDISGMPNPNVYWVLSVYGSSVNTGISLLLSGKELTTWPPIGGGTLAPALPNPTGNISNSSSDNGCYHINGYQGPVHRYIFAYNGGNYVMYEFFINVPYDGTCSDIVGTFSSSDTDTSQANHPIVKIAQAINNSLKQIPSIAYMNTVPYVGLPGIPATGWYAAAPIAFDSTGTMIQTNYCYLAAHSGLTPLNGIACVFGPS